MATFVCDFVFVIRGGILLDAVFLSAADLDEYSGPSSWKCSVLWNDRVDFRE